MRTDYIPATTFCMVCGRIIKDHQIAGHINGTLMDCIKPGEIKFDTLEGYLCEEHLEIIRKNLEGGLPMATAHEQLLKRQDTDDERKIL